jgi:phenylpyruvate tautomerase PptA (4-oxalocrotonate tautomerase family)
MPLVKINLIENRSLSEKKSVSHAVQAALVSVLGIPNEGLYQLINEYAPENFIHSDGYVGCRMAMWAALTARIC